MTLSQSSGVWSRTVIPALLTKMLTGPNLSSTFFRAGCNSPRAETSTFRAKAANRQNEADCHSYKWQVVSVFSFFLPCGFRMGLWL
jgi:hypothetical protein